MISQKEPEYCKFGGGTPESTTAKIITRLQALDQDILFVACTLNDKADAVFGAVPRTGNVAPLCEVPDGRLAQIDRLIDGLFSSLGLAREAAYRFDYL